MGKSLRLKHGWVAVVNRGQADINKRMTMIDARARESDFFRGEDTYRCVESAERTPAARKPCARMHATPRQHASRSGLD
jgi:hypothetical protein